MRKIQLIGYKRIEEIKSLQDPGVISIANLRKKLSLIARKYGPNALLDFDAGYNNIQVFLVRRRSWPGKV